MLGNPATRVQAVWAGSAVRLRDGVRRAVRTWQCVALDDGLSAPKTAFWNAQELGGAELALAEEQQPTRRYHTLELCVRWRLLLEASLYFSDEVWLHGVLRVWRWDLLSTLHYLCNAKLVHACCDCLLSTQEVLVHFARQICICLAPNIATSVLNAVVPATHIRSTFSRRQRQEREPFRELLKREGRASLT